MRARAVATPPHRPSYPFRGGLLPGPYGDISLASMLNHSNNENSNCANTRIF